MSGVVNETFKPYSGNMSPEEAQSIIDARKSEWEILHSYGMHGVSALDLGLGKSLSEFLSDPSLPEARKKALVAAISGKMSNLPDRSDLDLLSEQILGRSNYQRDMHNVTESIGNLIEQYRNTDYQEDYNKPSAAVSRERDAGINADVVGTDQGGEATDFDDQANRNITPLSDSPSFNDFASPAISIVQTLFGFANGVQDMIAKGSQIDSIDISNEKQIQDLVKGQISSSYSTKEFQDSFDLFKKENDDYLAKHGENDERAHQWKTATAEDKLSMFLARSVVKNLDLSSLSPRNRKRAESFARSISENSDFLMKLRQGTATELSQGRRSQLESNSVISAFSKGFSDFYEQSLITEQKYQSMYYEYMADIMSKKLHKDIKYSKDGKFYSDGQSISFADLQFDAESQQLLQQYSSSLSSQLVAEMQAQSNAQIQSLLKNLTDPSKKHSFFEQLAVFLVPHLVGFLNNFTNSAGNSFGSKLFSNSGPSTVVNAPHTHEHTHFTTIQNGN